MDDYEDSNCPVPREDDDKSTQTLEKEPANQWTPLHSSEI